VTIAMDERFPRSARTHEPSVWYVPTLSNILLVLICYQCLS
jgi:hypothetical protein